MGEILLRSRIEQRDEPSRTADRPHLRRMDVSVTVLSRKPRGVAEIRHKIAPVSENSGSVFHSKSGAGCFEGYSRCVLYRPLNGCNRKKNIISW